MRSRKENRAEADDTDAVGVYAVRGDTNAVMTVVVIATENEDTAGIIIIMMSGIAIVIIAAATGTGLDHVPDQLPENTIARGDGPLRDLVAAMVTRMRRMLDPVESRAATHVVLIEAIHQPTADVIPSDVRIVITLTDDTDIRRYDNETTLSKVK